MEENKENKSAHSNLFVGNLPADATEDSLRAVFASVGQVESCRVVAKDGKANGFVKMADVGAAEAAIAKLQGSQWDVKFANFDVGGKQKMFGGRAWGKGKGWGKGWGSWWAPPPKLQPRDEEVEKPEGPESENLYIKHLPVGATEEDVTATFQKAGEVAECKVLKPNYSLEWAALVRMATPAQAAVARQSVDNTFPLISPQALSVQLQTKKGEAKDDHCYIKNLPTNITKDKLEALFSKFGEVKWCEVMPPMMRGRIDSSCAALVEMGSPDECQKAITGLNEQVIPFAELGATVKVRYALKKEEKPEEAAGGATTS